MKKNNPNENLEDFDDGIDDDDQYQWPQEKAESKDEDFFGNLEKELLALEAIEKIKTELSNAPSSNSQAFGLNFALVDDRVYARLERLGQMIDWPVRYKETLHKLKTFLATHPRCREEFEVRQDTYNPIVHYVRCRHGGETVEMSLPTGMDNNASDELSVASALDLNHQPQENTDHMKGEALSLIREILLNQGSNFPMKLTLLNARVRWPQTYGRTFGSLKRWIGYLNEIGEAQDIEIIDNLGPGNDLVKLDMSLYTSRSTTVGADIGVRAPTQNGGPPAQGLPQTTLQLLNQLPQGQAQPSVRQGAANQREPYFPPLLVESQSGVRVSDYFFLPLPTDLIEISYHRAMANNTALVRRWTELRIIHECWSYDTDQFKKHEWLGDTVLRAELSKTLLLNYSSLFDISGLDARRQNAEQRLTMSLIFDELKLAQFVRQCPPSWVAGKWKAKCDFIEALLGELVMKLHDPGERGIPFGHPERESIQRFVRSVCEAALDRGAKMKSPAMRSEIDRDAERPGSGGYLMEELDRLALIRMGGN